MNQYLVSLSIIRNSKTLSAIACAIAISAIAGAQSSSSEDSSYLLTIDHYVRHESTVPSMAGDLVQIYVRERVRTGTVLRDSSLDNRVVLFVHGAGTPAEVAFDVPYQDYSWMAYLASAGFDVFSMDMTGYGRSTRPSVMNDPCNLSEEQQEDFVPAMLSAPCEPSYPNNATTIQSDWDDIDAVVDYIRQLRDIDRVSLIGWSLGGPRAGGYAASHAYKVDRVVLLAPAYSRTRSSEPPATVPAAGPAFSKQSHDDFTSNWQRQVGCAEQYEPLVSDTVWTEMLASDPVGATWGTGVRRAPRTTVWGWDPSVVGTSNTPMLIVAGIHDKQITPDRVRDLYDDLGSRQKVLIDLGCSSHNAMWERNHLVLFGASLEWLRDGTVNGKDQGVIQMGY